MLGRDIRFTFVGQLLRTLFMATTVVVVARSLGPDGQGMFALAVWLPRTVAKFAQLGLLGVNAVFPGRYPQQRESLFLQTFLVGGIGSALGLLVMAGFYFWLPLPKGQFEALSIEVIGLAMLLLPLENLQESLTELARGVQRIGTAAVISTVSAALQAAAMVVGLLVLHGGLATAILILAGSALMTIPALIWTVRDIATLDFRKLSTEVLAESLRFGAVLTIGTVAIFLVGNAGTYLLAQMNVPLAEIGCYSLALMLARQLEMVPTSVSQAFLPRLSNDLSQGGRETPVVFRKTFLVSMALVGVLALAGPVAIRVLFGSRYVGSILPFLCLVPGIGLFGSFRVLGAYLWAHNKPVYGMVNNWISLLVTVGLSVAAIPMIGIYGAASGNVVGLIALSVLTAWAYLHVSGEPWRSLLPRRDDLASLAGACRLRLKREPPAPAPVPQEDPKESACSRSS